MQNEQFDQIARVWAELKGRTFLKNARQRSQRRKSAWNQLLLGIVFPLWFVLTYVSVEFFFYLHVAVHPKDAGILQTQFLSVTVNGPVSLMLVPPLIAALVPAMIASNFLVYRIPAARRAMENEDRGIPGVDYCSSQRALTKVAAVLIPIAVMLALIGVALSVNH